MTIDNSKIILGDAIKETSSGYLVYIDNNTNNQINVTVKDTYIDIINIGNNTTDFFRFNKAIHTLSLNNVTFDDTNDEIHIITKENFTGTNIDPLA